MLNQCTLYLQIVKQSNLRIQVTVEKLYNFSWVIFNKMQRLSRWIFLISHWSRLLCGFEFALVARDLAFCSFIEEELLAWQNPSEKSWQIGWWRFCQETKSLCGILWNYFTKNGNQLWSIGTRLCTSVNGSGLVS